MSDVFISYARPDEPHAQRVSEALRSQGYGVWRDDDLPAHRAYADVIEERLTSAGAVVVLWSVHAVKSQWVRAEADAARMAGTLVQSSLDGTLPPMPFNQIQCANLKDWNGSDDAPGWRKLTASVAALAGPASVDQVGGRRSSSGVSVCVLPFQNMSGDPEQEYFSDGISEDITTDLSKVSALAVTARNTAFQFKGQSIHVADIARKIGVSHVLEGSVRKAGGRVRITAQLIDGTSGDHVWAERFDRDLTDIFAIQDEISKAIVAALRIKLLPEEKRAIEDRGTSSVEAYSLYLLARQQLISGSFGDPRRDETIARICQQATVIDPNYAQAWGLMAFAQAELRFWHGREADALPAAQRALELKPDMAEVRCVKARYLEEEGRQDDADREIAAAVESDPESWEVNREAARMHFRAGRIEQAVPYFEKAAALMETDWHNASLLITCYHALNDIENLKRAARLTLDRAQVALLHDPTNGAAIAVGVPALSLFGEKDRAREWIQRGLLLDPENLSMRYNFACALVMELKDPDAAIDMLELFFERVGSPIHLKHLEADPDLEGIRAYPRFMEMLANAKQRLRNDVHNST